MMLKKLSLVAACIVIVAAALYQFGGWRVRTDGSGVWPRFIMRVSDYEALDADRAGHRARPPLPTASTL